jgi:hypothetical protein
MLLPNSFGDHIHCLEDSYMDSSRSSSTAEYRGNVFVHPTCHVDVRHKDMWFTKAGCGDGRPLMETRLTVLMAVTRLRTSTSTIRAVSA